MAQEHISAAEEALDQYYEVSDTVVAQNVLYEDFVKQYGKMINKFQMYLLFSTGWGPCNGVANCGSAGYYKKVKLNQEL